MSLTVGARALSSTLAQTPETKALQRSSLDARVAGLRGQIETAASGLRDRDFKTHFVEQLITNTSVQDLLDKCHLESSSLGQAQTLFKENMLAHVQAIVGARAHRSEAAKQAQIDETIDELMKALEPNFKGLRDGALASKELVSTCTTSMIAAKELNDSLFDYILGNVEHRDEASRSRDASSLMKEFRAECKRRSRTETEPFLEFWRQSCIASGMMIDPSKFEHDLFVKLSKLLMTRKGYTAEDASKKAWHLVKELSSPAERSITESSSYLSSFVFALGANPLALQAYHHRAEAEPVLQLVNPKNERERNTHLKLEQQLSFSVEFERAFNQLDALIRRYLVKETRLMRTSYTPTETVLASVLRENPDIAKQVLRACLQTLPAATAESCRLEMSQRLLLVLQRVDPVYYSGDKGLDKASHFCRALIESLPARGTDSFEDMARLASSQKSLWAVEPSLFEAYSYAKVLAQYFPQVETSRPVSASASSHIAAATATRVSTLDDPHARPPASEPPATDPTPTPDAGEAPKAMPKGALWAITPGMLTSKTLRTKAEIEAEATGTSTAAADEAPKAPATAPPTGARSGINPAMLAGQALRKTARSEGEAGAASSADAGAAAPKKTAAKPPHAPGFDPSAVLSVKLRSSGTGDPRASAAARDAAPKEMSELEKRLAARRAKDGTHGSGSSSDPTPPSSGAPSERKD